MKLSKPYDKSPDYSIGKSGGAVIRPRLIADLRSQSTWKLAIYSIITLGIYESHYIRRQTSIIGKYLSEEREIPQEFVIGILIVNYTIAVLFIPVVMAGEGSLGARILEFMDVLWSVLMIYWAFKARGRMNFLLESEKGDHEWFQGLWTFLFTAWYFNYKINRIYDDMHSSKGDGIA